MLRTGKRSGLSVFAVFLLIALPLAAQQWVPLGPYGGDVRTLTRDPHAADRILLTTSAGMMYESLNGGVSWSRFAKLGDSNDFVLDSVIFHPNRPGLIYAAAWSVENNGGDVFRSTDNGRTWKILKEMHGKSTHALAMAANDPKILVAGALDGVFRSLDGGEHWSLISPAGHMDIRNIQSIAVDPVNPETIYAGTWHLPWKTSDGGNTWHNIKNGMIDDSDLFSIIIDPTSPNVVYASACSGIYKSENAGELFHKVQGMPFSARRTRVLRQDPVNLNVVYAGTTEGLWKTVDSGKTWARMTAPNIIVNGVLIDPAHTERVMIATDRGGVYISNNGAQTFTASNKGFAHRQVATVLVDHKKPNTIYAGLVNDKEFGGVFVTHNDGENWQQMSSGLNSLDVFALRQSSDGDLLAGTNRGIFAYRPSSGEYRWSPLQVVDSPDLSPAKPSAKGKSKKVVPVRRAYASTLSVRVNDINVAPTRWLAATASGLYASTDRGRTWHGGLVQGESDFISVEASQNTVAAATRRALVVSSDGGASFMKAKLPPNVTTLTGVTLDPQDNLYIATREGAYKSKDAGESWQYLGGLRVNNVASIFYDAEGQRLLATSTTSTDIFSSSDSGNTWQRADSGWILRSVRSSRDRVLATTAFDGVVAQPIAARGTVASGGQGSNK